MAFFQACDTETIALRTIRSRGPWLACGLCCPTGSSLTMASSKTLDPPAALFTSSSGSLPYGFISAGIKSFPNLLRISFPPCHLPYPGASDGCLRLFPTPPALAFAFFVEAQLTHPMHAGSRNGSLTRLQSSLYATARWIACPSPARAFTFKLAPLESPQRGVEYNYTGKQSIPVTGLSPVRYAALWAANRGHRGMPG